MKRGQLGPILLCIFIVFTIYLLQHDRNRWTVTKTPKTPSNQIAVSSEQQASGPHTPATESSHPIHRLAAAATEQQARILSTQSKSLNEAIEEYKRRYKIPPPPNFDKWYNYAKEKNVRLIDEYDTIFHTLLPFWALTPSVIRARARESLGFDNSLLGIFIRNGKVVTAAGGTEWQQVSTVGMMKNFVQHLPDMDLPFNIHDEPRVVIPYDDLSRLVRTALEQSIPAVSLNPVNAFTPPQDISDGLRAYESKTTRFNRYAHQSTWADCRASCPPNSPARALDDLNHDDSTSFITSPLKFISNKTAFSDICLYSNLKDRYGFFERPNAFNVVRDLLPVFSQSKISSFQDILYPSPWYWSDKVPYNDADDVNWDLKEEKLHWRGSTTGGFSRNGGWRRQHRQNFVEKINALDDTKVLARDNSSEDGWIVHEAPRTDFRKYMDVHFSHIGQCDPGDCDAQREFFEVVKPEKQNSAWKFKYLLDIDGNAFSGRFYAFLKSTSLVYKVALFREWHEEWIQPWLHYVPLGLAGDEYVEGVRYFQEEEEGRQQAQRIASEGRNWANSVLRKEDFEAWFFRLLLEYGRLVDEDRPNIGFAI